MQEGVSARIIEAGRVCDVRSKGNLISMEAKECIREVDFMALWLPSLPLALGSLCRKSKCQYRKQRPQLKLPCNWQGSRRSLPCGRYERCKLEKALVMPHVPTWEKRKNMAFFSLSSMSRFEFRTSRVVSRPDRDVCVRPSMRPSACPHNNSSLISSHLT